MFTQFDVEVLGSLDPRLDAEVIHLAASFFEELGIEGLQIRLNSMGDGDDRDRYRDAVRDALGPHLDELCELCRSRFGRNVLRVLDCKTPSCREVLLHTRDVHMLPFLTHENRTHFETVTHLLGELGRGDQMIVDGQLVRGLDYYTRTVFELHFPPLGARSALCGGGRYDHLVRDLGGPDIPAVGYAIGFTATMLAMAECGVEPVGRSAAPEAFVVAAGEGLESEIFLLAEELRRAGVGAVYDTEGKGVKAQMKAAGRGGFRLALILGPDELERGVVQLKDLAAGEQREVARDAIVAQAARVLEAAP